MKPGKKMMSTMLALFTAIAAICAVQDKGAASEEPTLQLRCSAELTDLANQLAVQYQQEDAGVEIAVATIPENRTDELLAPGGIALLSKACLSTLTEEHGMKVVVGRDVLVPVMNMNHPQKELILQKGITPAQFASIYKSEGQISWGQLLGTNDAGLVKAYILGKQCAKGYLAGFINATPDEINAVMVNTPEEMIEKVEADPNVIGFCTLACLVNMERNKANAGISLVPIDMDGDGELERFEDIYQSYAELSHGIFVGKYPRALYSRVYALTGQQQASEAETAFLEWMITGSQNALASAGILEIDYSEKASGLHQLYPASIKVADVPVKASATRNLLLIITVLMVLGILLWVFTSPYGKRQETSGVKSTSRHGVFGAEALNSPAGLFYDRSHTWTFMEKTGNVRVGIDDFIQHVTGPVSRVVMKSPGEKISRGETLLTIVQQGKQLEIKSPLSGVVLEQNSELQKDAALLNSDPYSAGWVYTVEPVNWMAEMKSYFIGEPYGLWLKEELSRLKDFFAAGLKVNGSPQPFPVMQDGGEIMDGVLEEFGPEVWEEFQSIFINHK